MIEKPTNSEASKVRELLDWTKVPQWLEDEFTKAQAGREYLHTEVFAEDNTDAVTCPDLLRAIWAKLAMIWPQDPEAVVRPPQRVEPPEGLPPEILAQAEMEDRRSLQLVRTAQAWLRRNTKACNMLPTLWDACLEILAAGGCWVKVGWHQDAKRDPVGRMQTRPDAQEQMLRLARLSREFSEGVWGEDDPRHQDLIELSEYLREEATRRVIQGDPRQLLVELANMMPGQPVPPYLVPEPKVFQMGTFEVVAIEDIRLDWERVLSPNTVHRSRRLGERVWMHRDQVAERWNLTPEEKDRLGTRQALAKSTAGAGLAETKTEAQDPTDVDLNAHRRGDHDVAVWEIYDAEQHRRYRVVEGLERYLDSEVVQLAPKDFFPYKFVHFNPAPGRFMPISDTNLGRKSQDELNQFLTDDREARIARYPWYAAGPDVLTDDDKKNIRARRPHDVVTLSRPVTDIKAQLQQMDGAPYEAELYQMGIANARTSLERLLGMPQEAIQGRSSQKFAEGIKVSNDAMGAQLGRITSQINDCLRWAFQAHLDFALQMESEESMRRKLGPWAYWPVVGREELAEGLACDVQSAGSRQSRRQDLDDLGAATAAALQLTQARALAAQTGLVFEIEEPMARIARALDLRLAKPLLHPAPMPALMPRMMPGMAAGPGAGAPGAVPQALAAAPVPGGAPALP